MILRSPYPDVVAPDVSLPGLLFDGLTPAESARTAIIDAATGREAGALLLIRASPTPTSSA